MIRRLCLIMLMLATSCPPLLAADQALDTLMDKAKAGDIAAQFDLAGRYIRGEGVSQSDKNAAKWYTKAAEQGDADAQFNLGVLYYQGKGVKQDYEKAAEWYSKAAKQGDPDGQYSIGSLYAEGQGIKQDYTQAAEWYTLAAKQGHPDAQANLARLYYEGLGVKQDYQQAYLWIFIAAYGGDADSDVVRNRDMVATQLTPAERQATQQAALALMKVPTPAATSSTAQTATAPEPAIAKAEPPTAKPAATTAKPEPTTAKAEPATAKPAATTAKPEPVTVKPEQESTAETTRKNGTWIVQVAAASSQANAEILIKKLKQKGFDAFSVVRKSSKGTTIRVLVGPQPDKATALKTQQAVDKAMGVKSMIATYNGR